MSTTNRSKLSHTNKYWLDQHRYYELKHFCLQYRTWKLAYKAVSELGSNYYAQSTKCPTNLVSDPTARCAEAKAFYSARMELVEKAAMDADAELFEYILKSVTEGISYEKLKARLNIPCGKRYFYDRYRKFFWLLSKARG